MAAVFKHSPTDFLHREAVWNRKWYFWALTDRQWSPWSSVQYSEAEPSRRPPSQHLTLPVYLSATRCENACMCMYIPIIVPATPPNLTSLFFCPPHCPACSQSWHGTISNLSPSCLLGLRGTGSLSALLPLPSRQLPLPSLSHKHSLRSPHCHLPTLQLRLLLTVSCKEYFTPSCFVCVFILHG